MNRKSVWMIALMFVLSPAALLHAQQVEQRDPVKHDITSFMTRDTVGVAKLHLDRIDAQEIQQWARNVLQDMELENGERQQRGLARLARGYGQFEVWAGNMKQAGAETVYIVLNARDGDVKPVVVVPKVQEQQVETVKTLLKPLPQQEHLRDQDLQTARVRDAVVLAPQDMIEMLQQPQPPLAQTQNLRQALTEVENAAIQIAFRSDSEARQAAQEAGSPGNGKFEGVDWVAVGLHYPDQEDQAFRLVLKAEDQDTAQAVASRFKDMLEDAAEDDDARPAAEQLAEYRDALEPEVENDRVIITLSDEQATELLKDALGPMLREGQQHREQRDNN